MRIRRGEVAAAVVVVCAVVGIWAFGQVRAQVRDDQRRSFEEAHKERYSQASAIVLDSEEQRRCVDGEGHTYSAGFGWEGRMEAAVQEAVCYGDPSEVPGLEPDDFRSWQNAESVVVVKMRLTNVDAFVPSAEESHRDPYEFNASIFNLRGSSVDDRAVVAGRGDLEPSPTNGYHFVLAPGQSRRSWRSPTALTVLKSPRWWSSTSGPTGARRTRSPSTWRRSRPRSRTKAVKHDKHPPLHGAPQGLRRGAVQDRPGSRSAPRSGECGSLCLLVPGLQRGFGRVGHQPGCHRARRSAGLLRHALSQLPIRAHDVPRWHGGRILVVLRTRPAPMSRPLCVVLPHRAVRRLPCAGLFEGDEEVVLSRQGGGYVRKRLRGVEHYRVGERVELGGALLFERDTEDTDGYSVTVERVEVLTPAQYLSSMGVGDGGVPWADEPYVLAVTMEVENEGNDAGYIDLVTLGVIDGGGDDMVQVDTDLLYRAYPQIDGSPVLKLVRDSEFTLTVPFSLKGQGPYFKEATGAYPAPFERGRCELVLSNQPVQKLVDLDV